MSDDPRGGVSGDVPAESDAPWMRDDGSPNPPVPEPASETDADPSDADPNAVDPTGDRDDRPAGWSRDWTGDVTWTSPKWTERPEPPADREAPAAPPAADPADSNGLIVTTPVEDRSEFTPTGEVVLGGVAVLAALLVASLVIAMLVPRSEPVADELAFAAVVPEQVEARWSVDIDGPIDYLAAGAGVVMAGSDPLSRLWAFDAVTGEGLWSAEIEGVPADVELHVIDDTVVVIDGQFGGGSHVRVFEPISGRLLWSDRTDANDFGVGDRWLFRVSGTNAGWFLRLYDPSTGQQHGTAIELDASVITSPSIIAHVTRTGVQLLDSESLLPVGGPFAEDDVAGIEYFTLINGRPVGFDPDGSIVTFGDDGRIRDEIDFQSDAFGDFRGRALLVGPAPGYEVGIISSGSSLGFTLEDGRLSVVWEHAGRVEQPVLTDAGPLSLVRGVDEGTGEVNLGIVDTRTGVTLAITDEGTTRESVPFLGRNGFVVSPEVGARERVVSFVDYDGNERWNVMLDAAERWMVAEGLLLTVTRGSDRSTLDVFG